MEMGTHARYQTGEQSLCVDAGRTSSAASGMDQTMVDVTDIPEAMAGDEVVCIGRQGTETITVGADRSAATGSALHEITTALTARLPGGFTRNSWRRAFGRSACLLPSPSERSERQGEGRERAI